jgi:hypothetical protein
MTTMMMSQDGAAVMQSNGINSDNVSIEMVIEGQHEVNLLDLGISAEDIAMMRRIDACLEEVQKTQQLALVAGTSEP